MIRIKRYLREIGYWIDVAQDRDSCEHGYEPSGFNKMFGNSRVTAQLATSEEGLSSVVLVIIFNIRCEQKVSHLKSR
jgi:hypothetical protein